MGIDDHHVSQLASVVNKSNIYGFITKVTNYFLVSFRIHPSTGRHIYNGLYYDTKNRILSSDRIATNQTLGVKKLPPLASHYHFSTWITRGFSINPST